VGQTFVGQTLVRQTLVRQTFVGQTFVGQTLVGQTFVGQTFMGQTLVRQTLVRANIDFSCLSLWCESFNMIVDDNILEQLLTHIRRLNIKNCSDKNKALVKKIPKSVERGLEQRHGI
jgi:hypothetical protein